MSTAQQSSENPAEKGETMLLAFYERKPCSFRPVIFVAPMDTPEKITELTLGRWHMGLRSAQRHGLALYFATYEKRYGFKHPEDPSAPKDEPLPFTVIAATNNDSVWEATTYDPDARH